MINFSKDAMFYNLDLISWAESKIEGKPLAGIMRLKAK
jgi:hypothetical protein